MYKQYYDMDGKTIYTQGIIRLSDMACIPFDPANTDAQQFAKWLEDGNAPEAAEEGGTVSPEWVAETIANLLPNG